MNPRIPLLLAAALCSTPAFASGLIDLLKLREGQIVQVREPGRDLINGTLVRVEDDHFCIQYLYDGRRTLVARCYPFTAIRTIAPSMPEDQPYVIETI